MNNYAVVFDTETTGLTKHIDSDIDNQPRMIEFGALLTDGNEIIDTLEFIVNPKIAIDEIITKITGLTNEDLRDKPVFEEFFDKIKDFFSRANFVIAHNLSFDKAIINYDLKRINKTLQDINFPHNEICTVEQTYPIFGRRMKLSELYKIYCGNYVQKHRALDDVKLLHEISKKINVYKALGLTK